MDWLLTVMLEIEEDLAEFFLIASLKISQVFLYCFDLLLVHIRNKVSLLLG